ncbi:MAG: hypothetical protein J5I98_03250, partial [Phaeodactylibacter sp.]|nr:hypothetical protein [Phaeodactylibacter sp.]
LVHSLATDQKITAVRFQNLAFAAQIACPVHIVSGTTSKHALKQDCPNLSLHTFFGKLLAAAEASFLLDCPDGVYFFQVIDEENNVLSSRKIVKAR